MPLVSVLIPSYNSAHLIGETLESVFAQSWPRLEVIVVDDGSKDDTQAAVAPWRDRIVFIRQQNQGLAAARNTGMRHARGELLAWLDSDDLWNRDKIALQVAVLQKTGCVLVASDFSAFDEEGIFDPSHLRGYYSILDSTPGGLAGLFDREEMLPTRDLAHVGADIPDAVRVYSGDLYRNLIFGNCLHPPTVMFTREAAAGAGFLDADFRKDCDYEYLLRLSRQGRTAFIDLPLIRYRYSANQMSSDTYLAEIAISCVLVMESLRRRDPLLLASPAFRRRLARAHLTAAHALADTRRGSSVGHLLSSLRWGQGGTGTETATKVARTVAKLMLPRWVLENYRKRRQA
jgi:glycosyltransferase involved in cell wall biosynthesis